MNDNNNNNLKVAYVNVRGLSKEKLDTASGWIHKGDWDLVFLSETWFSNEDLYKRHPYFVTSTHRPPRHERSSRDTAGILLLAAPHLKPHLHTVISIYHLQVTLNQLQLTAVYFPPTLNDTAFDESLARIANSQVLLGDFNCVLTERSHRSDTLKTTATQANLRLITPDAAEGAPPAQ